VRDLSGAFAQLPHLPKMLGAQPILDTLAEGCVQGSFVLRLTRPDVSYRTWWRMRPDDNAMKDPALELILPEAAELGELPYRYSSQGLCRIYGQAMRSLFELFRSILAGRRWCRSSAMGTWNLSRFRRRTRR
jgi:hypothetical protein